MTSANSQNSLLKSSPLFLILIKGDASCVCVCVAVVNQGKTERERERRKETLKLTLLFAEMNAHSLKHSFVSSLSFILSLSLFSHSHLLFLHSFLSFSLSFSLIVSLLFSHCLSLLFLSFSILLPRMTWLVTPKGHQNHSYFVKNHFPKSLSASRSQTLIKKSAKTSPTKRRNSNISFSLSLSLSQFLCFSLLHTHTHTLTHTYQIRQCKGQWPILSQKTIPPDSHASIFV